MLQDDMEPWIMIFVSEESKAAKPYYNSLLLLDYKYRGSDRFFRKPDHYQQI